MGSQSVTYSFNFKPDSITIISSGNYTIPANKYARVVFNVAKASTGSLDGTTVIKSPDTSWSVLNKAAGNIWSFGTGTGQVTSAAASSIGNIGTVGGSSATTTATQDPVFNTSTAFSSLSATADYWIPTGTVVAVSGSDAQAVIQIFSA